MANQATHIVKTWNTGDYFLSTDVEDILKGTINTVIDDNNDYHPFKLNGDGAELDNANNTGTTRSLVIGDNNSGANGSFVFGSHNKGFTTSLVGGGYYSDGSSSTISGNEMIDGNYSILMVGAGNQVRNTNTGINIGLFNSLEGEANGAIGRLLSIDGNYSFAAGYQGHITGNGSFILSHGESHNASSIDGDYSGLFAGYSSSIDGNKSTVIGGEENQINSDNSHAIGCSNLTINEDNVTAIGLQSISNEQEGYLYVNKLNIQNNENTTTINSRLLGIDSDGFVKESKYYSGKIIADDNNGSSSHTNTTPVEYLSLTIPSDFQSNKVYIQVNVMMSCDGTKGGQLLVKLNSNLIKTIDVNLYSSDSGFHSASNYEFVYTVAGGNTLSVEFKSNASGENVEITEGLFKIVAR